MAPKATMTKEYVLERWERWRKDMDLFFFFWGEGYRGEGWTWKGWEMSRIGVHDVTVPKNQ